MKNAEFIMAALHNCCLVVENKLFTETLIFVILKKVKIGVSAPIN